IRGGTQRIIKMELAGQNADATVNRVESLLDKLSSQENNRPIKDQSTLDFIAKIDATRDQWDRMKDEIAAIEAGSGSPEKLLELSERHFELADQMVYAAQVRAEQNFLFTIVIGFALILTSISIVLFIERSGLRHEKQAYHTDLLTRGKNMVAFEEIAKRMLSESSAESHLVVYTNIFNFRLINESYGHDAGDKTIVSLGRLLESCCSENEVCAHASADHFTLLLENRPGRAEEIAAALQKHLEGQNFMNFSSMLHYGLGICEIHKGGSLSEAISNATAALKEGALVDGIAWYDDDFKALVKRQNDVARYAAQGLAENEFKLYLQPQIDLATYEIVGAEALCRWDSE
ncbi:MAG: diguanylate cyclase, partial [Raoultibacter sp.]